MMVRERQITPLHRHDRKTEDLINRGNSAAGNLVVQLYNSTEDGRLSHTPVTITCDGITRQTEAGGTLILRAGETITLPARLFHSFHSPNVRGIFVGIFSMDRYATPHHLYHSPST